MAAIGGLLFVALWLWHQGAEGQLERNLNQIQELVAKRPGEKRLEGLRRARDVTRFFDEGFDVEAEQLGFNSSDRQSLAAGIHQYRSSSDRIGVRFLDKEHFVDENLGRATTHLTAEFLTGLVDLTGREAYRLQINWVESSGEWRIDYVRLLEVIEEPARRPF